MLRSDTAAHPSWPADPHLDDTNIPRLPPPASSREHPRSRTTTEIPPLLPRSLPHSPTRSSTFLPFFSTSRSPSPQRATPADAAEFSIDSAEERHKRQRPGKVERITSWFEGSSEAVNIGLVASPKKEQDSEVIETIYSGSRESSQSTTSVQMPIMQSANSSTSRFSFFRRTSTSRPKHDHGDLVNLNINEMLFPEGPTEEYSPAAFKNLQQNAEGALRAFQNACRENILALRKTTTERDNQADELEASQTRNEQLKFQLQQLADQATDQEKLIAELRAENERMKANEAALRSIRVITDHTSPDGPSTSSEYSHKPSRRQNRASDVSYAGSIDSANTDLTSATSVFSHSNDSYEDLRTPATSVGCPSPVLKHACRVVTPSVQKSPQTEHLRSLTTNILTAECQKCYGMRPNEAWEVIGVMKAESAALKQQILELEGAQGDVLNMLMDPKFMFGPD